MTEIRLTQAQVGAAVGLSQSQTSRELRAAGIDPSSGGYSLQDLARFAEWRVLQTIGMVDGTAYNYEAERARLTHEQANKVSLEVAELRGELVRASEVGPYWDDMVSSMRAKLVGMPPKLAAMIADAVARAKFQSQAEAAVYEALAEIEKDGLPAAARERHARAVGKSRAESGEAAAEANA